MRVLLDENVQIEVAAVLRGLGFDAESVNDIAWKGVQNGELVRRAAQSYSLLITRDKDFAGNDLARHVSKTFGIVLLSIQQQRGPAYAAEFARVWPLDAALLVGRITRLQN